MRKLLENITSVVFFTLLAVMLICVLINGRQGFAGLVKSLPEGNIRSECLKLLGESVPMKSVQKELYSRTARTLGKEELFGVFHEKTGDRLIKITDCGTGAYTDVSVDAVNRFHEKFPKLPVYTMIVPTAAGIYRGRLPMRSEAADQQKLIDDIYYNIDAEVTPLDVWSSLYSARDDYIYFRTDDRWTPQGAYSAYAATVAKLGLTPYSLSNYDVDHTNTEFRGALASESGIYDTLPDMINVYRCKYGSYIKSCEVLRADGILDKRSSVYSKNGLRSEDKYAYFLGTVHYKSVKITTAAEEEPKLLRIGSDYASCFLPFLAPHFSEILLIDPYELEEGEGLSQFAEVGDYDRLLMLIDADSFCERDGLSAICE